MTSTTRRDLAKELEDGIKPWTGPSIFTTPQPRASGSIASPIDISSSPEEVAVQRVRGVVRYISALPRTAYTPPKVHPFFTQQRARTVPLPAPASQRPRLVAHYSSTEASSSTSQSQSQSHSQETQSTFASDTGEKGKGKQKEVVPGAPAGWAEDAIDQIAEDLSKTRITNRPPLKQRSTVTAPAPSVFPKSAQTRPTRPPPSKVKPDPAVAQLPFFHYAKGPKAPKIAYTTSASEADDLISCLRGNVFGFDLEWPPAGKYTTADEGTGKVKEEWIGRSWDTENKKYVFTPGRTALVQICDKDLIVLVHLKDTKELPQSIVELVQDESKYKLGVQISGDGRKLLGDFPSQLKRTSSLFELTRLARRVDGEAIGPGNTLIALAKLTERYLGRTLKKESGVRRGNWANTLSQEQVDYAANDVYASFLIFERLRAMAKERSIDIDLSTFCSDLGDVPRSAPSHAMGGTTLARRASGSLATTPSQHRTLEAFIAGQNTETIAKQMGIQRSTVQGYLAGGLGRVHDDVLSDNDKRRFLKDVKDAYWVMRNHRAVIERITLDLKENQAKSEVIKVEEIAVGST